MTGAPALGLLAPAGSLNALACAAGVALARHARARRALVCLQGGIEGEPRPRGRLLVTSLPGDPDDAARAARIALAEAGASLPTVIAVSLRTAALDALLAAQDGVVVAPRGDPLLTRLTIDAADQLTHATVTIAPTLGPAARALAHAGLLAPPAIRRAVAEVLG